MLALNLTNPAEVKVPDIIGISQEEAKMKIEEAKLKYEVEKEEYNKDVPEGHIISLKTEIGNHVKDVTNLPAVKEGSTIKVIVSKGQEKTTVPKVVGLEKEEAEQALKEAKLEVEIVEETSKKVEEGYVISQETDPDTEAFAGDTVKIHVSTGTGIKQVNVISVAGKTEADAKKALEALGLKVNIAYDEDSSKDNGTVLKQSIEAGKTVDEGTTVTVTVNKLAEMKQGKVTVNLKSLLNYTPTKDEDGEEVIEKGKVKIVVGNDTIYNETKEKTSTNISASFSAKGNVTIKVYVDDILKGTKEINLNTTTSCTFE